MSFNLILVACAIVAAQCIEMLNGETINFALKVGTLTGTGVLEFYSLQYPTTPACYDTTPSIETTTITGDVTPLVPESIASHLDRDTLTTCIVEPTDDATQSNPEFEEVTKTSTTAATGVFYQNTSLSSTGTIRNTTLASPFTFIQPNTTFSTGTRMPTLPVTAGANILSQQVWRIISAMAVMGVSVSCF